MMSRLSGATTILLLGTLLAAGAAVGQGERSKGGHHAMHGVAQMEARAGGGKPGCRHGKGRHDGKKHHGGCKKHVAAGGMGAGGKHLFGGDWKQSLTADQKAELDRLHLQYARIKAPLKAGIKALEVRLAVLATSASAGMTEMEGPLTDLVLAKQEILRAKYNYITAQRNALTPQQRVSFDMEVIHKAMHGKKEKAGKGGHGKH